MLNLAVTVYCTIIWRGRKSSLSSPSRRIPMPESETQIWEATWGCSCAARQGGEIALWYTIESQLYMLHSEKVEPLASRTWTQFAKPNTKYYSNWWWWARILVTELSSINLIFSQPLILLLLLMDAISQLFCTRVLFLQISSVLFLYSRRLSHSLILFNTPLKLE